MRFAATVQQSSPMKSPPDRALREGAVCQVAVNAYERNATARNLCILHYGSSCIVCGFNFAQVYGEVGEGIIHVHHLRSLSDIGAEYEIDPVRDLRPVCPNCHAIIHCQNPAFTIEEATAFLNRSRKKPSVAEA
jgi:predicted HNH restriction endonuclease